MKTDHARGRLSFYSHQPERHSISETSSFGGLPYDRLLRLFSSDVGLVPALVWRADLVKNEITFLTDHAIPGLEDSIPRLLQDATSAEAILAA